MGLSTHYEENLVALIKQLRVQCECTLLKLIVHTTAVSVLRIPQCAYASPADCPRLRRFFLVHPACSDHTGPSVCRAAADNAPNAKFVTASLGQTVRYEDE